MTARFEFTTPTRIVFGAGSLREAAPAAHTFGRHAFVVTGRDVSRATPLLAQLAAEKVSTTAFALAGEPTIDDIGTAVAKSQGRTMEAEAHPEHGSYYRSDHFEFAKVGVPAYFTRSGLDFVDQPPGYGLKLRQA